MRAVSTSVLSNNGAIPITFSSPVALDQLGRKEAIACNPFVLPWLLGFLTRQLGPIPASPYLSFTQNTDPTWLGNASAVDLLSGTKEKLETVLVNICVEFST